MSGRFRQFSRLVFAALALAAIGSNDARAADLVIAMPNWPSGQATANILKVALKEKFAVDADATEMGTLLAFVGLDTGKVDIHPEVWLPNLDNLVKQYVTDAGTVEISPIGVPAWQGVCVTRAAAERLGVTDILDLTDPAKTVAFDTDGDGRGEMWIGAQTWSSTPIERVRANSYGYSRTMTLLEMPEDVGMAAVDAAQATDRPLVFACYAPHVVFKLHDVVRLTEPPYDPAKWKMLLPSDDPSWLSKSEITVGWDAAHYHIAFAASLRKEHPDIAAFLERVKFDPEEAVEMSYALEVEKQDPFEFAKNWYARNSERVDAWAKP